MGVESSPIVHRLITHVEKVIGVELAHAWCDIRNPFMPHIHISWIVWTVLNGKALFNREVSMLCRPGSNMWFCWLEQPITADNLLGTNGEDNRNVGLPTRAHGLMF